MSDWTGSSSASDSTYLQQEEVEHWMHTPHIVLLQHICLALPTYRIANILKCTSVRLHEICEDAVIAFCSLQLP